MKCKRECDTRRDELAQELARAKAAVEVAHTAWTAEGEASTLRARFSVKQGAQEIAVVADTQGPRIDSLG